MSHFSSAPFRSDGNSSAGATRVIGEPNHTRQESASPIDGADTARQNYVYLHVLRLVDAAILGYRDKAMATGGLDLLFNDYQLFGALTTGSYMLTKKFITDNPNTTRRFVEATARAIDWTQTKPRVVVVARFQDIIKRRGRDEDASIVTYWKSAGRGGLLANRSFSLYIDWFRANGDTAIGRLKPRDLYTNAFNPYRSNQS